ncbi:LLM class flavin-dependent oxidoreductase [Hyphomicrobium sp.]|uniref:LLM class flavin-dependent oxidoreductase n=1 Tax=Hyphomicrobium sp. TaxID=82 RepID=UPI001DCAE02F|nr:LLM class flavin-dependent oxidoreductase [Hyphomicrobium sp.]MBY0558796.1 LLM class flavin-dependent oxidoreductase [Hyphomicrobium sp.]
MRVGLLQEGDFTGTTMAERYREMINEVALADKLGFSAWGTSEQHFSPPSFSVSAPEVLYAAVAENTEQIILRVMASILVQYNHPVMIAERAATMDIISNGRYELCTGRSNNKTTLNAFKVPIATTQEQWTEGIELLRRAFTDEVLTFDGKFWQVGECQVTPKPIQKPYPPLSVTATSVKTHGLAGAKGLGVVSADSYFGWDYIRQCVRAYIEGSKSEPNVQPRNNYYGYYVCTAYCAETREEAFAIAEAQALQYFKAVVDLYSGMSSNASYEYMAQIEPLLKHKDDIQALMQHTPAVIVGTPDYFIETFRRLEEQGIDEVLLRIDGFGHQNHLKTIRLIGEKVIPNVRGERGRDVRTNLTMGTGA